MSSTFASVSSTIFANVIKENCWQQTHSLPQVIFVVWVENSLLKTMDECKSRPLDDGRSRVFVGGLTSPPTWAEIIRKCPTKDVLTSQATINKYTVPFKGVMHVGFTLWGSKTWFGEGSSQVELCRDFHLWFLRSLNHPDTLNRFHRCCSFSFIRSACFLHKSPLVENLPSIEVLAAPLGCH